MSYVKPTLETLEVSESDQDALARRSLLREPAVASPQVALGFDSARCPLGAQLCVPNAAQGSFSFLPLPLVPWRRWLPRDAPKKPLRSQ